ncbi:MAG: DUF3387 domain-containing protein [Labilibaculum sp.]|nr:DUF3387 domain-containing protein [Labilibaculum sp.]
MSKKESTKIIEELYKIANELQFEDSKIIGLAQDITKVIKENGVIDWSKRDDIKARLRLELRKTFMTYGYPADLAKLEADRVLAQEERKG